MIRFELILSCLSFNLYPLTMVRLNSLGIGLGPSLIKGHLKHMFLDDLHFLFSSLWFLTNYRLGLC